MSVDSNDVELLEALKSNDRQPSKIMEESSEHVTPKKSAPESNAIIASGSRVHTSGGRRKDDAMSRTVFTSEEDKSRKSPLPFRVATLIKNSSGVQLAYRGAGVLPMLKQRKPE